MANPLDGLDLGKNIGPLPLGAWIVVVGGGVGIAMWRRNSAAASYSEDEAVSAPLYPGVGNGSVGGWVDNETPEPATPGITDNAGWARAAINHLIAQGYDPNLSDSAVRKYVLSAKLSVSEYALMSVVLARFGPPPQTLPQKPSDPPVVAKPAPTPAKPAPKPKPPTSVPKPVVPPKPVAKPKPAPPKANAGIRYVVKPGDNLTKLAVRTWGIPNWQRIYNANRAVIGGNPNLIRPGQVLIIT